MIPSPIRLISMAAAACLSAVACVTTLPEGAPCTTHLAQLRAVGLDLSPIEDEFDRAWPAYLAAIAQLRAVMLGGGPSTAAVGAWADARDELLESLQQLVGAFDRIAALPPAPETREAHVHVTLAARAYSDLTALLTDHVASHQRLVQRSLSADAPLVDEWRVLSIYVDRADLWEAIDQVQEHVRDMTAHLARARRLCRESA